MITDEVEHKLQFHILKIHLKLLYVTKHKRIDPYKKIPVSTIVR